MQLKDQGEKMILSKLMTEQCKPNVRALLELKCANKPNKQVS